MQFLRLISEQDGKLLKDYAAQVFVNGTCLEVGSAHGASAVEILMGLPVKYSLVCSSLHGVDDYPIFKRYCLEHGVWDRVMPVTGDFRSLNNHVRLAPLAFLFLDHDHSESGMRDALDLFLPLCVNGTLLLFHDYHNTDYPAVAKYVDKLAPERFFKLESVESMAVFRALR